MPNDDIQSGRHSTDVSLVLERKRTDVALRGEVKTIEQVADEALQASRAKLDDDLQTDRVLADDAIGANEKQDERVLDERRRVDELISNQRLEADEAIRCERRDRQADDRGLLADERMQTDVSLRRERSLIDLVCSRSDILLAEEEAAHAVTKAAVATRDEVISIVSHDLQDPLSIISICSEEFLGCRGEDRLTPHEVQWVDTIRRHATSMFRLVTDLLDVQYIASGKLQIASAPSDLKLLITEMLSDFEILARRQHLTLSADLPDVSVIAQVDRERVRQVLANLISNALKFTPKGGVITVGLQNLPTEYRVCVTDTGPGVAEAEQERIFERFSQLGRPDQRGVGLGLFISKWIVDAHGGKIWVESEKGSGSSFFVSLPRARA